MPLQVSQPEEFSCASGDLCERSMRKAGDRRCRTSGSHRRKTEEDEAVDRISSLPDSLLLHALFGCAVPVSLMFRPFRGLCRSLSMLSFEECDFHACRRGRSGAGSGGFSSFVDHVVALHESPKNPYVPRDFLARDSPHPELDGRGVMSSRLDEWISIAFKKKVKVLDVDLHGCARRLSGLPAFYYRVPSASPGSSSLVELKLSVCNIESLGQIHLKSLQSLSLFGVSLNDEVLRNLVSGSPSLKKATIQYIYGLQVLKFDRHPSLEELNVVIVLTWKEWILLVRTSKYWPSISVVLEQDNLSKCRNP